MCEWFILTYAMAWAESGIGMLSIWAKMSGSVCVVTGGNEAQGGLLLAWFLACHEVLRTLLTRATSTSTTAGKLHFQIASLRGNACRTVCVCAIRLFPCATKVRVISSNTPCSIVAVFTHRIEKLGTAHVVTQRHSRACPCLYR
jgi:hypothetical protein